MPVCIIQIVAGKPSSAVVCCFKVSLTIKWKKKEKLSNRLTAAVLKDLFVTAEVALSKPFLFWLKRKLPHRFTHRLYVCLLLLEGSASGF